MYPAPTRASEPLQLDGALPARRLGARALALGCAGVGAATLALAAAASRVAGLAPGFLLAVTALAAAGLGAAALGARASYGAWRWGPADRVTALRIGLTAIVVALAVHPGGDAGAWVAVIVAGLALGLDGVDGWLARRTGTASRYGARLDMETDAVLVLALCALCWLHGKAGLWVLAGGALRYAFLAAGRLWPVLAAPLPPSRRRQTVCVVQVAALVTCLSPALEPTLSAPIAAGALALLAWSFALDVRWLARRARRGPPESGGLAMTRYSTGRRTLRRAVAALGCAALATLALPQSAGGAPARYTIDQEHLVVAFLVDHIGYAKVLGMFREASGEFTFDEATGTLSALRVEVETDSVDTNHRKRDQHLRSPDFLNSGEFPTMVFTASGASRTGDGAFVIDGTLELLGVERPLRLEATLNKAAEYPIGRGKPWVVGISARGAFERAPYGMTYGVDNGWVGNEVELIIELEARRQ